MTAGVSLLAVPAQFGAAAATRAVSLDVARTIFTALNKAELVALVLLLIVVRVSGNARKWWAASSVLAFIVLLQTVWLLPELAERARQILAGTEPAPSIAHAAYSTLELFKLGLLLIFGLGFADLAWSLRLNHRLDNAVLVNDCVSQSHKFA